MLNIKKIDVHVHTRLPELKEINRFSGDTYASPTEIRRKYDEWGIDKGFVLPETDNDCAMSAQSSEEAKLIAERYPDTFYWFCNLNPHMGNNSPTTDFSYFLNHYKALGAKGMGELTANLYVDDPLLDNLLYHCAECDMPVIIHMAPQVGGTYGIVDDLGLPRLEKALKKYPKLKILGHSMMIWSAISGDVTEATMNGYPSGKVTEGGRLPYLLKEYEGMYGDMSAGSGGNAFMRDPDFAYRFIEEFQDKLFFGTDICAPHNFMALSGWLDESNKHGCISDTAYYKICRGNAERMFNL